MAKPSQTRGIYFVKGTIILGLFRHERACVVFTVPLVTLIVSTNLFFNTVAWKRRVNYNTI